MTARLPLLKTKPSVMNPSVNSLRARTYHCLRCTCQRFSRMICRRRATSTLLCSYQLLVRAFFCLFRLTLTEIHSFPFLALFFVDPPIPFRPLLSSCSCSHANSSFASFVLITVPMAFSHCNDVVIHILYRDSFLLVLISTHTYVWPCWLVLA